MVNDRQATALVSRLISRRTLEVNVISPESVATEVLLDIAPSHAIDEVYNLAHAMLKQIARSILNRHFGSEAEHADVDQLELFPLQDFYPQTNGEGYIARNHMTDEDVSYNVGRLRKEGRTKLKHADALEMWGVKRHWAKQPS